jgi:hypothetical protein
MMEWKPLQAGGEVGGRGGMRHRGFACHGLGVAGKTQIEGTLRRGEESCLFI